MISILKRAYLQITVRFVTRAVARLEALGYPVHVKTAREMALEAIDRARGGTPTLRDAEVEYHRRFKPTSKEESDSEFRNVMRDLGVVEEVNQDLDKYLKDLADSHSPKGPYGARGKN